MSPSLRTLLTESIDYAGTFPPAELTLDRALANYREYRHGPDAWLLGRFVCPAARLAELPSTGTWLRLSVVLRSSVLADDAEAVREYLARSDDRGTVDSLELKVPSGADAEFFDGVAQVVADLGLSLATVFHEVQPELAPAIIPVLGAAALTTPDSLRWGLKIRTGGLPQLPTPEQFAVFITACRDAGLPWKATAGLHDPLSRCDDGGIAYGFLNVFVAGVLADACGLAAEDLTAILKIGDVGRFDFGDEMIRWQNHAATAKQVRAARTNGVQSFGSCSFEEPCEGLRSLGLL